MTVQHIACTQHTSRMFLSVSVPHQQSLPHREVCIESSTKFVCVCQARIQFAINHGSMDIMVQQLDAASETARLHCQLLHHLLDSLVLLLLKLYQTCANLPDILLRQVHADNITASSLPEAGRASSDIDELVSFTCN